MHKQKGSLYSIYLELQTDTINVVRVYYIEKLTKHIFVMYRVMAKPFLFILLGS